MPQVVIFAQKAETGSIQNVLLPFTTFRCTILGFPAPPQLPLPLSIMLQMFYKMSFLQILRVFLFLTEFFRGMAKKSPVK